ncbi:MAG TPA: hypothetical protein VIT44_18555, partial [Cyclobacteriaceae bacterium]
LFFLIDPRKSSVGSWDVISSKALIVIESDNFIALQQKLGDKRKSFLANQDQQLIGNLLGKRRLLYAIYKTDANAINGLFVIQNPEKSILDSLSKSKGQKTKKRNFSGAIINEVRSKQNSFAYALIDNVLVIGTSFLVEDAIRTIKNEGRSLFKKQNESLFQFASLKSDDGNIYFNLYQIGKARNGTLTEGDFAKSAICDIKVNSNQVILNGFTVDSLSQFSFLSLFKNQKPIPFSLKDIISQRSVFVKHYSFSNFKDWQARQTKFLNQHDSLNKTDMQSIRKKVDWDGFSKSIGNELVICSVEDRDKKSTVMVLKLNNDKAFTILGKTSSDSVYREEHSGYSIRNLSSPLTKKMFWPIYSSTDLSYYTLVRDYLIFGEDVNSLKDFINDIENDNTLGKSIEWNTFLSTTIQESTVNYYATGSGLQDALKDLGLDYFGENSFLAINKIAVQFSSLDDNFYTSATIQLNNGKSTSSVAVSSASIEFKDPIITSPQIVINHTSKASEIVLQDSLDEIHLVSSQNKLLWSLKLNGKIKGEIEQIDYLKNRKLQYFFTTQDQLHLVDRLGRYVTGFPKMFMSSQFMFSKVVDYDKSRNYRFLVGNAGGEIFVFDEKGSGLEGWNPKKSGKAILDAGHERILGKDYFFSILEDGQFYLFNRKGETIKNFPVRIQSKIAGHLVAHGNSISSSYFILLSEDGMLSQINILGELIKKEPLLKSSNQSRFGVVSSKDGNYIWRVDKNKIAILDSDGKTLFEKENPASEHLIFNHFYSRRSVFTIFDKSQDLLLVMDEHGKELTTQPLEATQPPSIEFLPGNKIKVNYVFGNRLNSLII